VSEFTHTNTQQQPVEAGQTNRRLTITKREMLSAVSLVNNQDTFSADGGKLSPNALL